MAQAVAYTFCPLTEYRSKRQILDALDIGTYTLWEKDRARGKEEVHLCARISESYGIVICLLNQCRSQEKFTSGRLYARLEAANWLHLRERTPDSPRIVRHLLWLTSILRFQQASSGENEILTRLIQQEMGGRRCNERRLQPCFIAPVVCGIANVVRSRAATATAAIAIAADFFGLLLIASHPRENVCLILLDIIKTSLLSVFFINTI